MNKILQDGAKAFPIKVRKTGNGFEASSPAVTNVPPASGATSTSAINNFKVAVDQAFKTGNVKSQ